jgi:hypothetical protein
MPPDGFDTVTLPVELIDELDRVAAEVSPDPSRPAAVRRLIDEYDTADTPESEVSAAEFDDKIDEALADTGAALTYDDAVAACKQALREELPDGVFRR